MRSVCLSMRRFCVSVVISLSKSLWDFLVSLSCRRHSFVDVPVSIHNNSARADLMTMSFRLLSRILQVCRSRSVKLSLTGAGFSLKKSCSTASAKVSSAGSLCKGGVQLLLAYSTRRIRLLNSWKSALTSVQLMLREVGQKEKPLASNWFSS